MNFVDIHPKSEGKRIVEIDYLKSVFILLMIAFHLAYFADSYPYLNVGSPDYIWLSDESRQNGTAVWQNHIMVSRTLCYHGDGIRGDGFGITDKRPCGKFDITGISE